MSARETEWERERWCVSVVNCRHDGRKLKPGKPHGGTFHWLTQGSECFLEIVANPFFFNFVFLLTKVISKNVLFETFNIICGYSFTLSKGTASIYESVLIGENEHDEKEG